MFEKLARKYNGRIIDDDCSVNSAMFKDFAMLFKREVSKMPEARLAKFNVGHYELSGFLEHDGRYIYFSYSVPRGEFEPVDMSARDPLRGVLYRKANGPSDYRGERNHFTSIFDFEEDVNDLFDRN